MEAPTTLVAGGTAIVSVAVKNSAATPDAVVVSLTAIRANGATRNIGSSSTTAIAGGGSGSFSFEWDALDAGGQPFETDASQPVVLRATVVGSGPTPASAQSEISRPIHVYGFSLEVLPLPSSTIAPASQQDLTLRIRNTGNVGAVIGLALGTPTPGWTFDLAADAVQLSTPTSARSVLLTVTAPADGQAGTTGTVGVTGTADAAPHVTSALDVTSAPISRTGAVNILAAPQPMTIDPGESGSGQITVANHQNQADDILLEVTPPPETTAFSAVAEPMLQTIARDGEETFTLRVDIPTDALAGDYAWSVRARATGSGVLSPSVSFVTKVQQLHMVDASAPTPPSLLEPGRATEVAVHIENLGNGLETVNLIIPDARPGWTIIGPSTFDIDAYDETDVTIGLFVPADEIPQEFFVRLKTSSVAVPTANALISFPATVAPRLRPAISGAGADFLVHPGQPLNVPLTLINGGNTEGQVTLTAQVRVTDSKPNAGSPSGWLTSVSPATVTLAPKQTAAANLVITPPAGIPTDGRVTVDVRLASSSNNDDRVDVVVRALRAIPNLSPAFKFTTPGVPYQDHPLTIGVDVTNTGSLTSGVTTLRLGLQDAAGQARTPVDVQVPPVLPGQTKTLEAVLPSDSEHFVVTAALDHANTVEELDESDNGFQATLELRAFKITVATPVERAAAAGEAVSYEGSSGFRIQNSAAAPESVILETTYDPPWFPAATSQTISVPANGQVSFPINIVVPSNPTSESVQIKVRAKHPVHALLVAEATVKLVVEDKTPPTITDQVGPGDLLLGETGNFSAAMADGLGVLKARLIVVSPDGTVDTLSPAVGEGEDSFSKRFMKVGAYRAYFWAQDNSTRRNQADTSLSPLRFEVRSTDSPVLRLVSPAANATIRPGTMILVSVLGTLSVESAELWIRADATPLRLEEPLQIPTNGWRDGWTNFTIRVTDKDDATTAMDARLHIDGTPPRIAWTPNAIAKGRQNLVQIRFEDASPIKSATLRLEDARGDVIDVPLTQNGTFHEGRANASFSLRAAFVIAEDAVGNRAYAEHDFAAGAGSALTANAPAKASAAGSVLATLAIVAGMYVGQMIRRGRK